MILCPEYDDKTFASLTIIFIDIGGSCLLIIVLII
jgi:hypothetical protein